MTKIPSIRLDMISIIKTYSEIKLKIHMMSLVLSVEKHLILSQAKMLHNISVTELFQKSVYSELSHNANF